MGTTNTIWHLSECAKRAIEEVQASDQPLRELLGSVASAASNADSSKALAPSVNALGRFAVDELKPAHPLSGRISEILGIYQAVVRTERRQLR